MGALAEKHRPDRVSSHEQGAVFHAHSRCSAGSERDPGSDGRGCSGVRCAGPVAAAGAIARMK